MKMVDDMPGKPYLSSLPPNVFSLLAERVPPRCNSLSDSTSSGSNSDKSPDPTDAAFWPSFLDLPDSLTSSKRPSSSPALRTAAEDLARQLGLPSPSEITQFAENMSPEDENGPLPNSYSPSATAFPSYQSAVSSAVSVDHHHMPAPLPTASNILWLGDLENWMLDEAYIRRCIRSLGWDHNLNRTANEVSPEYIDVRVKLSSSVNSSSGYCFLLFPSTAHAAQVMQIYETRQQRALMPGSERTVKLNWATGEPGVQATYPNEFSVFVGDLSRDTTEGELVSLLAPLFPSCKAAKIMYDQTTGQHKGYAFVRFGSLSECKRALLLGKNPSGTGLTIRGRPLRISEASVTANSSWKRSESPLASPALSRLPSTHRHDSPNNLSRVPSRDSGLSSSFPDTSSSPVGFPFPSAQPPERHAHYRNERLTEEGYLPENCTVFVGNLPSNVTEEFLLRHFDRFGDIVYAKVPPGRNCGFVQFTRRSEAEVAMANMQGYPILGTARLRLSWARAPNEKIVEHCKKLSQALNIPFEEVYKMVQNTDRSLIKQFAHAVSTPPLTSPTSAFAPNASFSGVPDRYAAGSLSGYSHSLPAPSYHDTFRQNNGSVSPVYLSASSHTISAPAARSASQGSASSVNSLADSFSSNLSFNSSQSYLSSKTSSIMEPKFNSSHPSVHAFARPSGLPGFL